MKVSHILTNAPHPYNRIKNRPLNLNQSFDCLAQDIACRYGGDLLLWKYDPESNSIIITFTDHRKFRVYFKEKKEIKDVT